MDPSGTHVGDLDLTEFHAVVIIRAGTMDPDDYYMTSDGQSYWPVTASLSMVEMIMEDPDREPAAAETRIRSTIDEEDWILVGYARRGNSGTRLKMSINVAAFQDVASEPVTRLYISRSALRRVLDGERAVTTLVGSPDIGADIQGTTAINRYGEPWLK